MDDGRTLEFAAAGGGRTPDPEGLPVVDVVLVGGVTC